MEMFCEGYKNLVHIRYKWKMGQIFIAFSEYLKFLKMKSNLQGMKKENNFQENQF